MDAHWTPEELAAKTGEEKRPVAVTTIYRNIPLMVEAGIIRRTDHLRPKAAERYEHVWGRDHHDHLICSKCGKRVEFSYPAIEVLQEAVAKEHGFTLNRHHLELVGVCPACQAAEQPEPGRGTT